MVQGDMVTCRHCKKEFIQGKNTYGVYCSSQCQQDYQWEQKKQKILAEGRVPNSKTGRRFLLERDGNVCQIPECRCSTWDGEPVPLVLDHIDGNPDNWALENIRLICPNCDALTDTYKGRNRGHGRYSRKNTDFSQRIAGASRPEDGSIVQDGLHGSTHNRRRKIPKAKSKHSQLKTPPVREIPMDQLEDRLQQLKLLLNEKLA